LFGAMATMHAKKRQTAADRSAGAVQWTPGKRRDTDTDSGDDSEPEEDENEQPGEGDIVD